MRTTLVTGALFAVSASAFILSSDSGLLSTTAANKTFSLDSITHLLPTLGADQFVEHDKREWQDVSLGLLLERDVPLETGRMHKRSIPSLEIIRTPRDLFQEEVELSFDKNGEVVFPTSGWTGTKALVKRKVRKAKKKARKVKKKAAAKLGLALSKIPKFNAKITWYTGHDLKDPYCADGSGWTPTDNSMIAAVTLEWGKNRPACGSFLQLRSPSSGKSIVVRVVDMCQGCAPGVPHVDLSLAAFKSLYDLDVGLVKNIQVSTLAGKPSKWSSKLTRLYGPSNL